jgi:hypothetical protein
MSDCEVCKTNVTPADAVTEGPRGTGHFECVDPAKWYGPPAFDITRRADVLQQTPLEKAIRGVMLAIEALPADERLTDAVVALGQAAESVADFVDGVPSLKNPPEPEPAVVLVARERERCASHAKALVEAEWGCCSGAAEGVLRNILSGRVR